MTPKEDFKFVSRQFGNFLYGIFGEGAYKYNFETKLWATMGHVGAEFC
jgi:hypothetical protein